MARRQAVCLRHRHRRAWSAAWVGDDQLEPAFRAQALALPGEADIAREIATDIDPDGVFLAREALTAAIAEACRSLFTIGCGRPPGGSPGFSPDAASAGRRALAAALLDLLSVAEGGTPGCGRPKPFAGRPI